MSDYVSNQTPVSLTEAYSMMERIPDKIADIISDYAERIRNEEQRHDGVIKALSDTFNVKKGGIEQARNSALSKANTDLNLITSSMDELKRQMDQSLGFYNDAEKALSGSKKINPSIGKGLGHVLRQVRVKKQAGEMEFEEAYRRVIGQEKNRYNSTVLSVENTYKTQISEAANRYKADIDQENSKWWSNEESIYEETRSKVEALDPAFVKSLYETILINTPQDDNYEAATEMPEAVLLGSLYSYLDEWEGDELLSPVMDLVKDSFAFALRNVRGRTALMFPYGNVFSNYKLSKFITYDRGERENALDYLRAIEMRLFMSIPCGKLRVTMMDPVDSGSNFSMFSSLGDDDERIISTRIWCDPKRIKEQLNLLIAQIEHVNQDCLRNEFDNIVEYNRHVGKNAEPLQALFVADFPRHFDKESCVMLEKIVSSGPKCGIYTFIAGSSEDVENCEFNIREIPANTQEMLYSRETLRYQFGSREYLVEPVVLPERDKQPEIFETLINGIKTSDRIIIYFDEISGNLTNHPEMWSKFDDSNGIDIPIGLEGASRTVQIHLGGELITQHHALISGTIGSGKSTLLHTIIMSILLRYSPEDVQIYLLDFKRGVEFKVYAESKLRNFRVISLDTEPEFGLAVLRYLEEEQAERAQEFHDKNCENIEKYNELVKSGPNNSNRKIPRIVLIIDEFHEMFIGKGSEDSIAQECERLLEQIVRQGRALGIHVILASQTLPDNLEKIYGQIMNRVALQSTVSSAQHILASDNEALESLVNVDPGKGVFNDGGGNRDANHPFRVAYFPGQEQRELLDRISERQNQDIMQGLLDETEFEKPRLLLSSIQDDYENPLNQFVSQGKLPDRQSYGCPLFLGEEIAMVNSFSISLTPRRRQNLLILGSDYKRASLLYGFSAISILFDVYSKSDEHIIPDKPIITFFDFSAFDSRGRRRADIMNDLCARFPNLIRVFSKEALLDGIAILEKEYAQRKEHDENHYVIFAGLNRARRLLDNDRAYKMPLKTMFINLVKDGPEHGVNYIVWANEPSTFLRNYTELLPEFDNRIVYDLKEEEYDDVIRSSAMKTEFDNNVLAYNLDDDIKKVRIYSMPLKEWLTGFMKRIDPVLNARHDEEFEEGYFEDLNKDEDAGEDSGTFETHEDKGILIVEDWYDD